MDVWETLCSGKSWIRSLKIIGLPILKHASRCVVMEFKKLQRLLERKRHFKIELYDYSMHVGHLERNEWGGLSLNWHERFSDVTKGRALKIFYFGLALSSEPNFENFTQTVSKKCLLRVTLIQNDYFASFNQCLPSWFLNSLHSLSWTMMESITYKMKRCFAVLLFELISPALEFYNWLASERSSVELWGATPAFLDLSNFPSAPMTPL